MLGNGESVVTKVERKPWWLYLNLLSLDAPLVALIWLHIFASTWRLGYHPAESYIALGIAVWAIYVGDRLLDISLYGDSKERLEPRHHFHQKHRKWLRLLVGALVLFAIFLVLTKMPIAIYTYLLLGGVLVAGFFGLSMLSSQEGDDIPYLKNIIAGLAFAYGVAMTAHVYRFEVGVMDLLISREMLCFTVLCIVNIAAIDLWEHSRRSSDVEVKAADELTLTLPLVLVTVASFLFTLQAMQHEQHMDDSDGVKTSAFYLAILTASVLLYMLNRNRSKFSIDALRVMADVSLMVPLLVFEVAR